MKVRSAIPKFMWGVVVCYSIVMFFFGLFLLIAGSNAAFQFVGLLLILFSLITWLNHWVKQEQTLIIDGEDQYISIGITEETYDTLTSLKVIQKLPKRLEEIGIKGGIDVNWGRRVIYFFTKTQPPEDKE